MYKNKIWKNIAPLILTVLVSFSLLVCPSLSLAQAIDENTSSLELEQTDLDVPSVPESPDADNVTQEGQANPEQTTGDSGDDPINSDNQAMTEPAESLDETNDNIIDESTAATTTNGEETLESAENNLNGTQNGIAIDESDLEIVPNLDDLDMDLEGESLELSNQDGFAPGDPVGRGGSVAQILVVGGPPKEFGNLQDALDEVQEGESIQLVADIVLAVELQARNNVNYILDLNGHTVSGNKKVRILNVQSGNITIQNGSLADGYAENSGGAIYMNSNSNLQLVGVTFKDNIALHPYLGGGGAIYLKSPQLVEIKNCTFSGNQSRRYGGAICIENRGSLNIKNSRVSVTDSVFSNNAAIRDGDSSVTVGGAVYIDNIFTIEFTGVQFLSNRANKGVGALYVRVPYDDNGGSFELGQAIIEETTFSGNTGRHNVADLEVEGNGKCTVSNTIFEPRNYADSQTNSVISVNTGLAASTEFKSCRIERHEGMQYTIYINSAGKIKFDGCRIIRNLTGKYDGATGGIYIEQVFGGNTGNIVIDNSIIKNNTAKGNNSTGGIYLGSNNKLTLTGGALYNNECEIGGASKANDLFAMGGAEISLPAVDKMSDGLFPFDGYAWRKGDGEYESSGLNLTLSENTYYTASKYVEREIAQVGDVKYESLQESVGQATSDSKIKIIAGDDGTTNAFTEGKIKINKNLTIDMNGKTFYSSTVESGPNLPPLAFSILNRAEVEITDSNGLGEADIRGRITVAGDSKLKFSNINNVEMITAEKGSELTISNVNHVGKIIAEEGSELTISNVNHVGKIIAEEGSKLTISNVDNAGIINNGDLKLAGNFDQLNISLGKGKKITVTDDFQVETLNLELAEATLEDIQSPGYSTPITLLESESGDNEFIEDLLKRTSKDSRVLPWLYTVEAGALKLTPPAQGIHLSSSGNDNNNGSYDSPVKTFAKAKTLLGSNAGVIYVTGTVNISSDETWSLEPGQKLVRHPNFKDNLVNVKKGGQLTLENITLDGLGPQGVKSAGSLIMVQKGGKVLLSSGSILQNNYQFKAGGYNLGGAIKNNGSLQMVAGSTIENCQAQIGGGVYTGVQGQVPAKFTMNGGKITGCKAYDKKDSAGGGVAVAYNGQFNFAGGEIANNDSAYAGGGISLGAINANFSINNHPTLVMTGGKISRNTAKRCGGGIFVQMNGVATISEGEITENKTEIEPTNLWTMFSGGGIYVNGGDSDALDDGILNLTNVLITGNMAEQEGGGIAGCPASSTLIYQKDGATIYANTASKGKELYLSNQIISGGSFTWSGPPEFIISPDMQDGSSYEWKDETNSSIQAEDLHNSPAAPLNWTEFYLHTDSKPKIDTAYKVKITNNSTNRKGGGIGSNGIVIIGKPSITDKYDLSYPEKETEVTLEVSGAPVFFNAGTENVASPQPTITKFELIGTIPGASIDENTGTVTYIPPLGTADGTIVAIRVLATYGDASTDLADFIVHVKAVPNPVDPTPAPVDPTPAPIEPPPPAPSPVAPSVSPAPTPKEKLAWALGVSQEGAYRGYSRYDYILGSHKNLHFAVNADNRDALIAKFSLVDVWGRAFGFSPQSDILLLANGRMELAASFLETLKPGSYILSVTYREGEKVLAGTIRVVFEVVDGDSAEHVSQEVSHRLPATGGNSVLKSLLISSGLIALGLYLAQKQKS